MTSRYRAARPAVLALLAASLAYACSGDGPTAPRFGPPAALLIEGGQDQSAVVGTQLPTALTVKVVDAKGRPVIGQAVTFRVVSGGGSVLAGSAMTSDVGIATERWALGPSTAEDQQVEASVVVAGGSPLVGGFRATPRPDVPASVAKVAGDTQAVIVGSPAPDSLAVRVADRHGNPVPNTTVRWTVTSGGGTLGRDSTATNAEGIARTRWTVGQRADTVHRVNAAVGTLAATFEAMVQEAAVGVAVVTPAAGAASGAPFTTQPVVRLVDASGNTASASTQAITLVASAGGTLVGVGTVTPISGIATFAGAGLSGLVGEYTLTYSAAGLNSATQVVTLAAGAPAQIVVMTQPAGAVSGAAFTTQPVVELRDAAGNRATSTATVTASVASGGGTLAGTAAVAAVDGVATFTNLRIDRAGAHRIQFGLPIPSVSTLSDTLTVAPGAPSTVVITPNPAIVMAGNTVQLAASTQDAAGNVLPGRPVTWTSSATAVATVSSSGLVTASPWSGVRGVTMTATDELLTGTVALTVEPPVQAVAAGENHSMIVKADGSLWAMGSNASGQLGDGTTSSRSTPVWVMTGVQSVSTSWRHSMILKADGTLWATGFNESGQLGDGTTSNRSTPVQVMTGVRAVAAGGSRTMILKTDGTLWATGDNSDGQLGNGTKTNRSTPVQVMTGVQAVAAGWNHTMILKTDSTLWATGFNASGEFGDGTSTSRSTPAQVMTGVVAVAVGQMHTMIVKADGTLWATGGNFSGQLGDGTRTSRLTPVQVMTGVQSVASSVVDHSIILKADGTLWGAGSNFLGQLGDGTVIERTTPVQVMTGVQAVATGARHTIIVKTDGTLWATGSNASGQFGDGSTTSRLSPVRVLP